MVQYTPPPKKSQKDDEEEEDSLEDLLSERLRSLADTVAHIEHEAKQRVTLSELVIASIYEHYMYVRNKLIRLISAPTNINDDAVQKSALEKQLDGLKQEVRTEKVTCWQDTARLNRDFRTWLKQYTDMAQKVGLLIGGQKKR